MLYITPPMAYDAARQRIVVLGGYTSPSLIPNYDTWLLGPTVEASHQTLGPGCGAATLDTFGEPELGRESFALDVAQASAMAPLAFLLSAQPASLPIGPCTVYVGLAGHVALPADASAVGFASVRLSVPTQPSLLGASLYAQSVVLEPSAPLGFTLTSGLSLRLGE